MIRNGYILTLFALILWGCTDVQEGKVIAEAFGKKLYDQELNEVLTEAMDLEDSVLIEKEFIRVWVAKQVLLHQAGLVLSEEEKDKSEQLENYKNDLLIYDVLNKLAEDQVDTSFTVEELEEYYNENIDEFELSQNIIKINFFKIPEASEDVELLWSNFKAGDESIYPKLLELSKEGGNYYLDKSSWVYFDDILKEVPINTYNQEHFLNNNKYIQRKDGDFLYFVAILDFRITSGTSPFSMEVDHIRNILLMKRYQELIKEIETNLVEQAYKKHNVRIH